MLRAAVASGFASLLLVLVGCSPKEPPRWPEGGARIVVPKAIWERGEDDAIEIRENGQVVEDGDVLFVIDRVGRVVDSRYEPLAILLPEGNVVGTDNRAFGYVGVTNAAPPWSGNAWIAIMPDGAVTAFTQDGERRFAGRWTGCAGAAQRTCTLVTHLVMLRRSGGPDDGGGVTFGVGIGVML
jgi:hypothetical protein